MKRNMKFPNPSKHPQNVGVSQRFYNLKQPPPPHPSLLLKLRASLINQKNLMPMCYRRYRRQTSVLLDIADLSVHSLYLPCSPYRLSVSSVVYLLICVRVCAFLHCPRLSPAFKDVFFLPPFLFSRIYLCQCTDTGRWGVKNNPHGIGEEDQRESTIGCANGREQYLHPPIAIYV